MSENSNVKASKKENSNMKAPKKENSKNISIWWIILALVIIALVFSIVAVVIALHYTNVQLEDYAQKDMFNNYAKKDDLDQYTKNDEFDGNCDKWLAQSDKVVQYSQSLQIQSKGNNTSGFVTNAGDDGGYAMINKCGKEAPGQTLNFKLFKDTTGCSSDA